jgi:lipopolysaccharide transport system ATP-binding protein
MSDDVAIRVENLSKRYRIGLQEEKQDTLVGEMLAFLKRPGQNLQRLRRLTRFSNNGLEEKDVVWALRDVSFEVKQGEVIGVIGRNGAGKSTLLKILSRITYPTTGRVELHGRVSSLLEVGTGFHPELTGRENIYLNGTILGMRKKEIDRKFDEIVAFSEVEKFIDTPVKHYSSGMRVRLAFSVAAHLEPEILLVDEVLAVGDAAFQMKSLGKMDDVARAGRTVLFISHNMGMVRALCRGSILLDNGSIVADGKTEKVINSYLATYVENANIGGQVQWNDETIAPGGKEMRLCSIRLLGPTHVPQSLFNASEPIQVEIIYEVLNTIHGMRMVLILITQEGEIVFTSTDDYDRKPTLHPGKYQTVCIIPPQLLNHKQYYLKIRSDIPNVKWLLPDEIYLSIKVSGGEKPGTRQPESWPGVVAPTLSWTTQSISERMIERYAPE